MPAWHSERSRNGGIDEITLPTAAGRLWLCGKHFVGPDPEAALHRTGAAAVVCLNEADEFEHRYPTYAQWLRENGPARAIWFPIPDMHVPAAGTFGPFLEGLIARLAADQGLIVTCGAGMGRAGTVAAAVLLALGLSLDDALEVVAQGRPTAGPQTTSQMDFLAALPIPNRPDGCDA